MTTDNISHFSNTTIRLLSLNKFIFCWKSSEFKELFFLRKHFLKFYLKHIFKNTKLFRYMKPVSE